MTDLERSRHFLLEDLRRFNTAQKVKERGFISCIPVVGDNEFDVCSLFLDKIGDFDSIYVGGLADGAILLSSVINANGSQYRQSYVYQFYVRKVAKNGNVVEQCFLDNPIPDVDNPVIIVDDVLNTGFSIARAAKAIEKEWGYKPTLAVVLLDNEVGGKEFLKKQHGIECRSIFTGKEVLG